MAGLSAGVSGDIKAGAAQGRRTVERGSAPGGAWLYGRWVPVPAQKRSQRSFVRFLDAAEMLLATRHWHEVSVQQIVRRADASVGSFYNRFADKMALLHCLDDRIGEECERALRALVDELEHAPSLITDAPGIVISLFMRLCTDKRGVIRALDITRKTTPVDDHGAGADSFGQRFDHALADLAAYLCARDGRFRTAGGHAVASAFRESFWLARERLVYSEQAAQGEALHRMLLGHFHASLDA
ncbi:TetR/AcrR family transcriptional regulator [Kordiimonas aestuarii]|uniref:TetR/AcrR family transcriptional regulator n=1 Tax=Kordiimonas aestuarii TaxID=1005925 RepID=UPI0021CFB8CF|nr:TetR/AcrR family transcriptional regulator [Kordiimonas aestuarii]